MNWMRGIVSTQSNVFMAVVTGLVVGTILVAIALAALLVRSDNDGAAEPGRRDISVSPHPNAVLPVRSEAAAIDGAGPPAPRRTAAVTVAAAAAPVRSASASDAGDESAKIDTRPRRRSLAHANLDIPDLPLPDYLVPYRDPAFGTKVVRVTDPGKAIRSVGGTWQNVARHHYSLDQSWNADMSLLMLTRGTRGVFFLDGRTYEPRFRRDGPGDNRWHPTRPDIQIYVKNNRVAFWNVRKNTHEIVATIEGYTQLRFGPNKGFPSNDGRMLAILAKAPDKRLVAFAYDLEARKKYPDIDVGDHKRVSYATISPLGRYVIVRGVLTGSVDRRGDATLVYDLEGNQVGPMWRAYGRPSHFDLAVDDNGDEVAVGVSKSDPDKRRVIKRRLRDGAVTVLTGPGYASHTSARNVRMPGWVFVTYSENKKTRGRDPYHTEIVAVRLDGSGEIRRIAHTRSVGYDQYLAEPHGSPSPDGTRVIWASNWGVRRGSISAYVAEMPAAP